MDTWKKLTASLIFMITSILISAQVFGQTIEVVTEEYPPYNYTENGIVTGFSTDVVKEVLDRAGLSYKIQSHPWAESYKIAETSPNTLIYSMGRNIERESLFKWVDVIARTEVFFYKLKSRPEVKIKSFADVKKYKIGAVEGDFRTQWLEKQGLGSHLTLVASDKENMKNLFNRKIDIFPIGEFAAYKIAHQEGQAFSTLEKSMYLKEVSADLYMAFSLQSSDVMVEKSKNALHGMKSDGTYNEIKAKYSIFSLPIFKFSSY